MALRKQHVSGNCKFIAEYHIEDFVELHSRTCAYGDRILGDVDGSRMSGGLVISLS